MITASLYSYNTYIQMYNQTHAFTNIHSDTNIYRVYMCAQVPTYTHSPVGALVCHPALFSMRACCALWLVVIDDSHGEADHLGGPIYTGRKSNQLH